MGKKYKSDNENLSVDNDQLGENKSSTGGKNCSCKSPKGKKTK